MVANGKYLSKKEAAEYTGYSLSRFCVLVKEGYIPYTKPCGKLYFNRADLDKFIRNEL